MYALVTGRSSTFAKRHLIAPVSVIDNGFRGELFGVVWNIGHTIQEIQPGERIVQVLPMMNVAGMLRWRRVETLSSSERADSGFGSTGR
jgi:dUTPase